MRSQETNNDLTRIYLAKCAHEQGTTFILFSHIHSHIQKILNHNRKSHQWTIRNQNGKNYSWIGKKRLVHLSFLASTQTFIHSGKPEIYTKLILYTSRKKIIQRQTINDDTFQNNCVPSTSIKSSSFCFRKYTKRNVKKEKLNIFHHVQRWILKINLRFFLSLLTQKHFFSYHSII